jgi:hypothetical protein
LISIELVCATLRRSFGACKVDFAKKRCALRYLRIGVWLALAGLSAQRVLWANNPWSEFRDGAAAVFAPTAAGLTAWCIK